MTIHKIHEIEILPRNLWNEMTYRKLNIAHKMQWSISQSGRSTDKDKRNYSSAVRKSQHDQTGSQHLAVLYCCMLATHILFSSWLASTICIPQRFLPHGCVLYTSQPYTAVFTLVLRNSFTCWSKRVSWWVVGINPKL